MNTPDEIFKLLIKKSYYVTGDFMCNAVYQARNHGVITIEDAHTCILAIQEYMFSDGADPKMNSRTMKCVANIIDGVDMDRISIFDSVETDEIAMKIYSDWDNRPVIPNRLHEI